MKFILILATMFALSTTSSAFACTAANIVGDYTGSIDGGGPVSVTTFKESDGVISGSYVMSEHPARPGELSSLVLSRNVLTGVWNDEFGSGTIEFHFALDCKSFTGNWNGTSGWQGTR